MYNNRGHINHKNVTSSSSSLIDTFCVNYKNRTKLLDQKSKQIHIQENGGAKDLVVIVCRWYKSNSELKWTKNGYSYWIG